jgi:hypothetical protein
MNEKTTLDTILRLLGSWTLLGAIEFGVFTTLAARAMDLGTLGGELM